MDFRSFLKDRYGFDKALIIVDRLMKRPILIPYYKTIDAKVDLGKTQPRTPPLSLKPSPDMDLEHPH